METNGKQLRIKLVIEETDGNSSTLTTVLKREFVTSGSDGTPKFYKANKAIKQMLFKMIDWNVTNAPLLWWTIWSHKNASNILNKEILTYDPNKD